MKAILDLVCYERSDWPEVKLSSPVFRESVQLNLIWVESLLIFDVSAEDLLLKVP